MSSNQERSPDYDAPEPWWRVTITFGALTRVNTAQRRFRCEGHIAPVQHYIDPGQRYVQEPAQRHQALRVPPLPRVCRRGRQL